MLVDSTPSPCGLCAPRIGLSLSCCCVCVVSATAFSAAATPGCRHSGYRIRYSGSRQPVRWTGSVEDPLTGPLGRVCCYDGTNKTPRSGSTPPVGRYRWGLDREGSAALLGEVKDRLRLGGTQSRQDAATEGQRRVVMVSLLFDPDVVSLRGLRLNRALSVLCIAGRLSHRARMT